MKHTLLMKHREPRQFEFRIKYNAGKYTSAMDSYHYYMAETAEQAFVYHIRAMERLSANAQHLCVERRNPWSNRWEDTSEVLNHEPVRVEHEN